jgi:hypothetical protein
VSIKNKLVTAVTTAGLLAGLFGSAFVPAVRAGATAEAATDAGSLVWCSSADTDVDYTPAVADDTTCYAIAAATVDLTVRVGHVDADGGTADDTQAAGAYTVTSVGTTINGLPAPSALGTWSLNSTSKVASVYTPANTPATDGAAGLTYNSFTVRVVAPAAGSTATVTLASTTPAVASMGEVTIIGVGSSTAGVASGAWTVFAPSLLDGDQSVGANAGLTITSADHDGITNTLVAAGGSPFALSGTPAVAVDGAYVTNINVRDAYNAAVTGAYGRLTGSITGPAGIACAAEDDAGAANAQSYTAKTTLVALADNDGDIECVATNDGDAGTSVMTVTVGSLTFTRTIIWLGGLDSITLSGPSHMATAGAERAGFFDALGVVCKDDAGNIIGDGGGLATSYTDGNLGACADTALSFEVLDGTQDVTATYFDDSSGDAATETTVAYEFNDEHIFIDSVAPGAGTGTFSDTADDFSVAQDGNWSIPWELCQDGDEGETRNINAKVGVLESNQITITCVENKVKITSLTALATGTSGSATSGANGQTIKVSVAATDGYGRPAGTGAKFTFTTVATGGGSSTATASFGGGSATLTITLGTTSGAQYVIYSATDGDQVTTGAQAFAQKISFTVSNAADALVDYALTKSGAKVTGSNFAARATVKVEVENASKGTVKVYTRKANAAGKVIYTIAGRGTFYVTMYTGAAGAEVLSNTVTVKR